MPENEQHLEAAVDAVIAECEGNTRAALRVLVLANSYLEAEVERLAHALSRGHQDDNIRQVRSH